MSVLGPGRRGLLSIAGMKDQDSLCPPEGDGKHLALALGDLTWPLTTGVRELLALPLT